MKIDKSARSDRVEQALRWTLALALIAAVCWAWGQGGGVGPLG
ncbi:hypothetical protein [Lysobacter sp.]|nr:hypothetical protein [Lysobacter sp.]HZX77670.1 hypothetical protein [Lysobacter sp.]